MGLNKCLGVTTKIFLIIKRLKCVELFTQIGQFIARFLLIDLMPEIVNQRVIGDRSNCGVQDL
jgi:hypothetical protein